MRLRVVPPLHLDEAELARRQARYARLAPPGFTLTMTNLPAGPEVPRSLASEADCRASDRAVYREALRTDPGDVDGIFLDCVLDPALEALQRDAPLPVYGILRLSAGYLASLGLRLAAVTRNRAIAEELERRLAAFGLAGGFHGTVVLDLAFEAISDDAGWNGALARALDEVEPAGVDALINGCSAVEVRPAGRRAAVVDPTELALRLLGLAAERELLAARAARS